MCEFITSLCNDGQLLWYGHALIILSVITGLILTFRFASLSDDIVEACFAVITGIFSGIVAFFVFIFIGILVVILFKIPLLGILVVLFLTAGILGYLWNR